MSEEIRPALTAEEWAAPAEPVQRNADEDSWVRIARDATWIADYRYGGQSHRDFDLPLASRHAIAALCLYGQPFGFDAPALNPPYGTIVEALRQTADAIDEACGAKMIGGVHVKGPCADVFLPAHFVEMFRECADRIEALLPPEKDE